MFNITNLSLTLTIVAVIISPSLSLKNSYARLPPSSFKFWIKICLKRVAPFLPIELIEISVLNSDPTLTRALISLASGRVICPSGPSGSTSSTTRKVWKTLIFFCSSLNSTLISPRAPSN